MFYNPQFIATGSGNGKVAKYIVHLHHPQYLESNITVGISIRCNKKSFTKSSIAVDAAGTQTQTVIQDIAATNTAREQWFIIR